jgi:hypothetical protein
VKLNITKVIWYENKYDTTAGTRVSITGAKRAWMNEEKVETERQTSPAPRGIVNRQASLILHVRDVKNVKKEISLLFM